MKQETKNGKKENQIQELQQAINTYSYPANYAYDITTLEPKGQLVTRMEYLKKYHPGLFEKCTHFLSVGSSLGYMLLYHSRTAEKCVGIEPDIKAVDIVQQVLEIKEIKNVDLHKTTFKGFRKQGKFDLIWMGNVFHYMYLDYGWKVAEKLAAISDGRCVIEAPLEGKFLMDQSHLYPHWGNTKLMSQYTLTKFMEEMGKYFDIEYISPSGTDPDNRVIVTLVRPGKKKYSLNAVNDMELLREQPYSKIYKTAILGKDLICKKISIDTILEFDSIYKSYMNLKKFGPKELIVEVYDYRIVDDGNQFEILMEYIDGFPHVLDVDKRDRKQHALSIVKIIQDILRSGYLPCDAGIENYMIDGKRIKMIDVDVFLEWRDVHHTGVVWFIKKLKEMIIWCPEAKEVIEELIEEVLQLKARNNHIVDNSPELNESLEKAKGIISEKRNLKEAIKLLNKIVHIDPYFAEAYHFLGVAFVELNNNQLALKLFKTACDLDRQNRLYLTNYVAILRYEGKIKEAKAVCQEYLSDHENDEEVCGLLLKLNDSLNQQEQHFSIPS